MSDDRQIHVPESFLLLFQRPGSSRLIQSRDFIESRHELCEDLAQALMEPTREIFWSMNLDESTVLDRTLQGLCADTGDSTFSQTEAWWVVRRLCELMGWPQSACPEHPAAQE